ncbi:type IV pilin protein [Desulfobotulus sp. H1]|uniref:Type IV pilin protein n=1 Tax=Desulfobotulus pelophilus TaxID=2823377 RepID=A0ABT3NCR4_9BACT|nr:type IV pilin protein [Desulfobotulus pelophilus]
MAWPQYTNHVLRSGRSDARASLMERAQQAERFYVRNNTYTGAMGAGLTSAEGRYAISFAVTSSGGGFTLTATPTGGQARDTRCNRMVINHQGQKTARTATDEDSSAVCW